MNPSTGLFSSYMEMEFPSWPPTLWKSFFIFVSSLFGDLAVVPSASRL